MHASTSESLVTRLRATGRRLPLALRRELLDGDAAVPALVAFLERALVQREGLRHDYWPALHAIETLADLGAPEAVPVFVRYVETLPSDDDVRDHVLQCLPELGAAALDPLLAAVARAREPDVREAFCCALSRLGVRDGRIFVELARLLERDPVLAASLLADYGDPAALPLLASRGVEHTRMIEADPSDFGAVLCVAVLVDAYERLGGERDAELEAHLAAATVAFESRIVCSEPFVAPAAPRRNDPCICGSGRKYKKCCSGTARARQLS